MLRVIAMAHLQNYDMSTLVQRPELFNNINAVA